MTKRTRAANILGELTAEADDVMLKTAFLATTNYRALVQGTDFRFVVGRRGSGKSALFNKLSEVLQGQSGVRFITNRPTEEKMLAFRSALRKYASNYTETRIITRLTWKVQILSQAVECILDDYKATRVKDLERLHKYKELHEPIFSKQGMSRALEALRVIVELKPGIVADEVPEQIAEHFDLGNLQRLVTEALGNLNRRMIYLYDGLDEGWVPDPFATGLLGGLAKLASEFRESHGIHCMLFIRDNMFRALAQFDGDYSRNIEGNTLRLHWDQDSLLSMIALRLRAAFAYPEEQDVKTWDRFAKRGLEGKEGFLRCLELTLYRPRDLIALLNGAYRLASTDRRDAIIDSDIDRTATMISQTRLMDLCKEYEQVFPGLPKFAEAFRHQSPRVKYGAIPELLSAVADRRVADIEVPAARDFGLLSSGDDAFSALYSVGFLGMADADGSVRFCHDGSNIDIDAIEADRIVIVHPCYWRALDLQDQDTTKIVVKVDDEEDLAKSITTKSDMADMRRRKLALIINELGTIREGRSDAHLFEKWAYDAARYLFVRGLDNISWKPNPGQVQQRDIVGTLRAVGGFWRRISRYDVNQLIIEVKNFQAMTMEVFRQAWGYLNGPYGKCMLIITRSEQEELTDHERAWVKEGYDNERKLVILVPALLLQRMLRKMQNPEQKGEYIEKKLGRRMDMFEREFVHSRTPRKIEVA